MREKLEVKIDGLKELFNEKFDENSRNHADILKQVMKTNGTVKSLSLWRSYIMGGMTILSILVVPTFIYFLTNFLFPEPTIAQTTQTEQIRKIVVETLNLNNQIAE